METLRDVAIPSFYTATDLKRGRTYYHQGAVQNVRGDVDAGKILGSVQGTQRAPYETKMIFRADGDKLIPVQSVCSCPVGVNCKHGVALFLQAQASNPGFCLPSQAAVPTKGESKAVPVSSPTAPPAIDLTLVESEDFVIVDKSAIEAALDFKRRRWLEEVTAATTTRTQEGLPDPVLVYSFEDPLGKNMEVKLELRLAPILKSGRVGKAKTGEVAFGDWATRLVGAIPAAELELIGPLMPFLDQSKSYRESLFHLRGPQGYALLQRILATGRVGYEREIFPSLQWGPARKATASWRLNAQGLEEPVLTFSDTPADARILLLATEPPCYLDPGLRLVGTVETELAPLVLVRWLNQEPLKPLETKTYGEALRQALGGRVPTPSARHVRQVSGIKPTPVLELRGSRLQHNYYTTRFRLVGNVLPIARPIIRYGTLEVHPGEVETMLSGIVGNEVQSLARSIDKEQKLIKSLKGSGLHQFEAPWSYAVGGISDRDYYRTDDWSDFLQTGLDALRAKGWEIREGPDFPFALIDETSYYEEWEEGAGQAWFEFEAGFKIGDQRIAILPYLGTFLEQHPGATLAELHTALAGGLQIALPDGRRTRLPGDVVQRLLKAVFDLLNREGSGKFQDRLRLDGLRAANIVSERAGEIPAKLQRLKAVLAQGLTPQALPAPEGFAANLREYQQVGHGWLRYLAETGFGGVLADDMGLGKTVQSLAHIVEEKRRGQLDGPVLIVSPTSVVGNWESEARRFAPSLRVLVLHGLQRKEQVAAISEHDLVLTTYPLIIRDQEIHAEQRYGLVIFDEAQYLKNTRTKAFEAAVSLPANRRLALTGTPMENNLGELWAIYAAVQPGLFPDQKSFTRHFRTPIEKANDTERRTILRARIAPFTLRRTKEAVLTELPPKTEIVTRIDLTDRQVELYESVRASMERKVRDAMAARGLARSHIVVLEALLKLRQVCCDPRLLKATATGRCTRKHSAKLEALLEQIEELVSEGRRVLLFSQFVEMLHLIRDELEQANIGYVELTGQTKDRAKVVNAFQAGEAPVFLISLKAGGSGLNLTAADTVIHYDPWWNPAVERQATDRAHRMGQEKPVFVYKLITKGTIEEKILALQERKSELLSGILTDNPNEATLGLTEDIVADLLAPLQ